ncbi:MULTISPECIES: hypothetical protein [Pseudomonas syringae group]|uniref:hypothetical protein n=1 Tax=Pseudomonas syringae group TaxID=136849 RepID=UPI0006E648F4|nr:MULTISPECIES: hypothetical protein [Pseudomonas syringae group]KPX74641.1 hypothetical protein ALO84_200070 [Pseudomonas syringae pv. maculicola]
MKIAKGFIQDVLERGEGEKAFSIIGLGVTTKNRNGFEVTTVMEFQVRGEDRKKGLQNAYRALKGTEVYVPYDDEIDTYFKDNPRIRYSLQGPPLRLVEERSVSSVNSQKAV